MCSVFANFTGTGAIGRALPTADEDRDLSWPRLIPDVRWGMIVLAFLLAFGIYRGSAALSKKFRSARRSQLPVAEIPSWHPEHLK